MIRGELNINGGANSVNGEDEIFANDNGAIAQYSYSVGPDRISPIAGPANLPRTNFVGINYDSSVEFVRLDGTPLANLIQLQLSPTTRFFIDGNEPTTNAGDQLVVSSFGGAVSLSVNPDGSGSATSAGAQSVSFVSIENASIAPPSFGGLVVGQDFDDRDEVFSLSGATPFDELEMIDDLMRIL